MKYSVSVSFVLLWAFSCGCTASVYPCLNEDDLVGDIDLNGTWIPVQRGDDIRVSIDASAPAVKQPAKGGIRLMGTDHRYYDFQFGGDPQNPHDWVARIGKIGDQTYAELSRLDWDGPPLAYGLPLYTLVRLELKDDELKLYPLSDCACRELLRNETRSFLIHPKPSDMIEYTILTLPTDQLQRFIKQHQQQAFTNVPRVFRRIGAPSDGAGRHASRGDDGA